MHIEPTSAGPPFPASPLIDVCEYCKPAVVLRFYAISISVRCISDRST